MPVLTTTTNGSSEVVTEGADGYVIHGEPSGLASGIAGKVITFCQLLAAEREAMHHRARAKAEGFTTEANAATVVRLLAQKGSQP